MGSTYKNADITDPGNVSFPCANMCMLWERRPGSFTWAKLYKPTADSLRWDKPAEGVNMAVGLRDDMGFAYVQIEVTGRTVRTLPLFGVHGPEGIKARVRWASWDSKTGTFPFGEWSDCWLYGRHRADMLDYARKVVAMAPPEERHPSDYAALPL